MKKIKAKKIIFGNGDTYYSVHQNVRNKMWQNRELPFWKLGFTKWGDETVFTEELLKEA
jgi:hypothetical protein